MYTIIAVLIILAIYLWTAEIYLKRKKGIFTNGRKEVYVIAETIVLLFVIISYIFVMIYFYSKIAFVFPMFLLFFVLAIIRGIEEWRENRQEKVFYQEWLEAVTIFLSFIVILIGEG